ncbi:MAG: hypothetical protein ABW137_19845 [Mycobacterium sp.]
MAASQKSPLGQPRPALPPAAGGSINGMRVLMGIVLVLIAIAAVSGVVMAMSSGQPQVAFIIGLLAAAFFARIGC